MRGNRVARLSGLRGCTHLDLHRSGDCGSRRAKRLARWLAWLFQRRNSPPPPGDRREPRPRLSGPFRRGPGRAWPCGCGNICSCWSWRSPMRRGRSMRPIGGEHLRLRQRCALGAGVAQRAAGDHRDGPLRQFRAGGYGLGVLGFPTYSVARPLDNRYLDRFLTSLPRRHWPAPDFQERRLRADRARAFPGGVLAFLADQYAGEKGCWVDFFGRPASAYKAIALLAMEYDAPVAVCLSPRRRGPCGSRWF